MCLLNVWIAKLLTHGSNTTDCLQRKEKLEKPAHIAAHEQLSELMQRACAFVIITISGNINGCAKS